MIYYTVSPNNYIYLNTNASLNFNNIVVNHTYMSFTFKILKKKKKHFSYLKLAYFFLSLGVGCVIAGALCICIALCRWLSIRSGNSSTNQVGSSLSLSPEMADPLWRYKHGSLIFSFFTRDAGDFVHWAQHPRYRRLRPECRSISDPTTTTSGAHQASGLRNSRWV